MLKIERLGEVVRMTPEFGGYLPFKCDFIGRQRGDGGVYWRLGNFESSLVEIEVDKDSGVIASFSLVMFDSLMGGIPNLNIPLRKEVGVPLFPLESWQGEMFLDEKAEIQVFFESDALMVAWSNVCETTWIVESDGVSFGVGPCDRLCWIYVQGLPKDFINGLNSFRSV
ncbi:hypothetical protein ACEU07_11825 [Chromobacterium violaceum]|uniref:hypothetical protein n=1 Tax=Chromobacterium violaceum TaxID=536 RepID=UPI0035A61BC1